MQNTKKSKVIQFTETSAVHDYGRMMKLVDGQFGEKPWFTADGLAASSDGQQFIKTTVVVAVNLETKTFSVIEIINPDLVCIIGSGNNFTFNEPPSKQTSIVWEN